MTRPLVSVVIPTRDRAGLLPEAIESVLSQDYPAIECVVVDGGSTDGTVELLRDYGRRLRWISEPDSGPSEAIEKGLAMTSGPIVTWLNDDDFWLAGAVSRAVERFGETPRPDVVYGACLGVDGLGRVIWIERARPWTLRAALIEVDHVINQPASFVGRDALVRAGGLQQDWIHDHDLWVRIGLAGGRFATVPERLAATRIHAANRSMEPVFAVEQRLAFVERWFVDPRVPPSVRDHKALARSNAYLRGLHYLRPREPRHWLLGARWMTDAVREVPSNAPHVLWRPVTLAARKVRRALGLRANSLREAPHASETGGRANR